MPTHMLFKLRWTRRRVDGHWDSASHQHAEERVEIFDGGGQHQRDGRPRLNPSPLQGCGHALPPVPKLGVAHRLGLLII